ncbi:hypothetical protein AX15_001313 [Amanita polypyramis BW_CC]|nr:hypothetical protein AX15_001313 [Amanita polypyramis BW_CC]
MIITPQNTEMTQKLAVHSQEDGPPPYDVHEAVHPPVDYQTPVVGERVPLTSQPPYGVTPPRIYHYVNPRTNEQTASLLPPDHPEMVCLQTGMHDTHTTFGILGILAAIIWFPIGIGCCLLDRKTTCRRCGAVLSTGCCD